ncbi:hypothetical protein [Pantoea rwandensis]|uniref:hypothetical protein n=1 Tax=Pantoea rwandensis TaxID=1076550 RepID=UPI00068C03ED|nr:hypothetical protein [Pantoea rwandensis]
MADEEKKEGNRAVGVLGGGGLGTFILHFAPMFKDEAKREIFIAAVPFISVLLSEIFTFITALVSLDAQSVRLRIRLKFLKWRLYWGKKNKSVSQDIRDIAQRRYDVIVAFEMGVYTLEYLIQILAQPPTDTTLTTNPTTNPVVAPPPPPSPPTT